MTLGIVFVVVVVFVASHRWFFGEMDRICDEKEPPRAIVVRR